MKREYRYAFHLILILMIAMTSCTNTQIQRNSEQNASKLIIGTWKLISGTTIQGRDTVITDYTQNQEMIKIINETHFAFLRHDLKKGVDSTALFVAGGGLCFIKGNKYTEHLQFFNQREWEGNSFEFEFTIKDDTLITQGLEQVEELGVNYYNIEKYHRVRK